MKKEDVIKIKEIIENNEKEKVKYETKLEQEMEYIKKEYNCSSLEEVEDLIDKTDEDISKIEEEKKEMENKLEKWVDKMKKENSLLEEDSKFWESVFK
jgi:hypothetical protein